MRPGTAGSSIEQERQCGTAPVVTVCIVMVASEFAPAAKTGFVLRITSLRLQVTHLHLVAPPPEH